MKRTLLVAGTHSWRNDGRVDWYCPGHPFVQMLEAEGVTPLFLPDDAGTLRPFGWSTRLGGVGFGDDDLLVWAAGGLHMYQVCVPPLCPERRIPGSELCVISHSHGLQPVLFACGTFGLRIDTLISVAPPIRKDMREIAARARPNIGYWLNVHGNSLDRWQWFGALFDGNWTRWFTGNRIERAHPLADQNAAAPTDHSELLRDPTCYDYWKERNWLTRLKG